jgi:hypothetical protein
MKIDPMVARLAALAAHLKAHEIPAEAVSDALMVRSGGAEIVVVCAPYPADAGRLWFFAEPGRAPLAEADQVMNAVVALKGRLAVR